MRAKTTIKPLPGLPDEQLRGLSRQRRYQLRKRLENLCAACGTLHIDAGRSKNLCTDCCEAQRVRMAGRKVPKSLLLSLLPDTSKSRQARALRFASPDLRVTEIAKMLGVSAGTVTQAINGRKKRDANTAIIYPTEEAPEARL